MAHFVFFVLLFAGQVIGGFSSQSHGSITTILTIDGGGVKGIIPATVLDYLDKALKAKDPNADLAHYFDAIGGTSTGSQITTMLATPSPDDPNRGTFTPAQIVDFYKQNYPHIFNQSRPGNGPMFDGEFALNLTRELLKDTRINQTLTHVVITSFDIKTQKPVIFSNYKLENVPHLNGLLSDILMSSTAAPTILPPYYFENDGVEFNMADGGIAANNPTRATVSEVVQQNEDSEILVLSLGTGTVNSSNTSGIDFIGGAAASMTEYYVASLFEGFKLGHTYLRIEEYNLNPAFSNAFNVTQANMDGLEETGKQLLQENVLKLNLDTFDLEKLGETNAQALDRIADILYEERQRRLKRKSMEKGGRPIIQTPRVLSDKTQASGKLLRNLFN
ncbi:patatin-2-Kuras 4-like isoform X2 [Vigna unguiculata]|uniref:patatin-2-Kuras 4-like isoform X2 n=1 Tax=Vigna unguiculata TaxID=3917 RepID=UPI0010171A27|nr:patatin-2-Kuras 4-like isoform X2 [Vigna unguiculata]